MKRIGYLYEKIYDWSNLLLAFKKARKSKQSMGIDLFTYNWEKELLEIQRKLADSSFCFKPYKQFTIYEPKERVISCAPFSDRVVHHAICNIINPILDKSLIVDSYACRHNKGMHKALKRAFWFYKNSHYHYRFDIKKFYYTIDHEILLDLLKSKFKDRKLLKLLDKLIGSYSSPKDYYFPFDDDDLIDMIRNRGLPIGNLSSQIFANYYLSQLDHFVREQLHFPYYIRYMDDIVVFDDDFAKLKKARTAIVEKLKSLRLHINDTKDIIQSNTKGLDFLGFRLYQNQIRIRNSNLKRFKRKLHAKSKKPIYDLKEILRSFNGHLGYLQGGHTRKITNIVLNDIEFREQKRKWKLMIA